MELTFLGTGTSTGVPVLTCSCPVCLSADPRDARLRVSVWIKTQNKSIVIDTGPDFRQQAFRAHILDIDAVLFTHEHRDHTAGLDDIRPYNYLKGKKNIPIYAQPRVMQQLKNEFYYALGDSKYPGVPLLIPHEITEDSFLIGDAVKIIPIPVKHLNLDILGYRIGDFSYITDANFLSEESIEICKGSEVLVLNALQSEPHVSHFKLSEAIEMAQKIGAKKTYFTHIGHKMGLFNEIEALLPDNIHLAYDGLKIKI
jgi:phosphoribosyl 1,2-cyclic phosphate phosphodiesterase